MHACIGSDSICEQLVPLAVFGAVRRRWPGGCSTCVAADKPRAEERLDEFKNPDPRKRQTKTTRR